MKTLGYGSLYASCDSTQTLSKYSTEILLEKLITTVDRPIKSRSHLT